jgi:hypothetical protein
MGTVISFWVLFVLVLIAAVYLNNIFTPKADFYDDCKRDDVKFMYTVKLMIRDLPVSFLTAGHSIIVILQHRNVCLCRWNLRLTAQAAGKSRYKLIVGRSAILKDMDSVRLEHNSFGKIIHMESLEIVDRSSNQIVFRARIPTPISMLPVTCREDQRQVFAAEPGHNATVDQRSIAIRRKVSPTEYLIFVSFAFSILLICSLNVPFSDLTTWQAIANGIAGALIAFIVTLVTFYIYKMLTRHVCESRFVKFIILAVFAIIAFLLSLLAVLVHARDKDLSNNKSSGIKWLSGFSVGLFILVAAGLILICILRCYGWKNETFLTTTTSTANEKRYVPRISDSQMRTQGPVSTSILTK